MRTSKSRRGGARRAVEYEPRAERQPRGQHEPDREQGRPQARVETRGHVAHDDRGAEAEARAGAFRRDSTNARANRGESANRVALPCGSIPRRTQPVEHLM